MATIQIETLAKPIAVGLEWHALRGHTSERKEVAALAKETGAKIGCLVDDDESGVSVLGIAHERAPGAACGAAWLAKASHREAIVLIEPIGDNKLWMCAVRAGTPVQNLDIVVDLSALHEKLPEFLADSPDARICSTLENLDTLHGNVSPQSFAELVSNTKPERLVRIAGASPFAVVAVLGTSLALGGYFGGTAWLQQVKRKEAAAKLAVIAQQQKKMGEEQVRAAQAQHQQDGVDFLRKEILTQPAVGDAIPSLFAAIESVPLSVAGWTLTGLECSAHSCDLSWQREKNGTVVSFMRAAEEHRWQLASAAGDLAVTTHPVEVAGRDGAMDAVEASAPFQAALESRLQQAQLLGVRYTLAKPKPLDQLMPKVSRPASPGHAAPAVQPLPWSVGQASIKGSMLFELHGMPQYVDHTAIAFLRMKADLKLKQWELEIKYATR